MRNLHIVGTKQDYHCRTTLSSIKKNFPTMHRIGHDQNILRILIEYCLGVLLYTCKCTWLGCRLGPIDTHSISPSCHRSEYLDDVPAATKRIARYCRVYHTLPHDPSQNVWWCPMGPLVLGHLDLYELVENIYHLNLIVFWSYLGQLSDWALCSYGHLLVITGYKWDYTFYKWSYKYL
jgi:hypothetical protein